MGITVEGIPNATQKDYDFQKTKAILSIGTNAKSYHYKSLQEMKKKISLLNFPIRTQKDFAKQMGYSERAIQLWARIGKKD